MMNFGFRGRFFKNQKKKRKKNQKVLKKKGGGGRAQGVGGHYPVCLKKNEDESR